MDQVNKPVSLYLHRGTVFRKYWPFSQYLVTNISVILGWIFFRILNRTTVLGKKNVPRKPNTLLLCNHQSMIDSFLVGMCAFFPASLYRPALMPWNPAAAENFYRTPFYSWLADNWKCIPIRPGRKDVKAIFTMAAALKFSPLTLFPEGTRSRNGEIGRGRAGTGLLIMECWPTVIPVCIDGMDRLLPIGKVFPRIFKHLYVSFGKPVDFSEFKNAPVNKESAQAIVDKVMAAVAELREDIHLRKFKKRR